MSKSYWALLLVLAVLFTSCIPTKRLTYLQGANEVIAQSVNPVEDQPYRIQSKDILNIRITASNPELVSIFTTNPGQSGMSATTTSLNSEQGLYFNGYAVDDRGNIRMPILNEVSVIGLTTEEIRVLIEKRLLDEHFNASANLFVVVKLAGFRYTINGEVRSPGQKILYQDRLTIFEAIANAGDIEMTGDRQDVVIVRKTTTGTEFHSLDLTDRNVVNSPNFYLQPNDFIYVKPLPQKSWGTGTTGLSTFTTIVSIFSFLTTLVVLITR